MLHSLQALASTAVMERATLLANHVIGAEPAAMERLRRHAGRVLQLHFEGWPSLLPALPQTAFRITPAGLVEWCGAEPATEAVEADLRVAIDVSNPALVMMRGLVGERPQVDISGDAQFAADVNWLFDNLRWDIEDDLARVVGQAPAHELARFGRSVATALRTMVGKLSTMAGRRDDASPPR